MSNTTTGGGDDQTVAPTTLQDLSDLLRLAVARHGTSSLPALSRIAQDAGRRIDRTTLSRIKLGRYSHQMQTPTIDALAYLAGVPVDTVRQLIGREPSLGPFAPELPDGSDELTRPQREAVKQVVRVYIDTNQQKAQ